MKDLNSNKYIRDSIIFYSKLIVALSLMVIGIYLIVLRNSYCTSCYNAEEYLNQKGFCNMCPAT